MVSPITHLASFEECCQLVESKEITDQLRGIHNLGLIQEKRTTKTLFDLLEQYTHNNKWDLANRTIISLAQLEDSSCLFPLINHFNLNPKPQTRQRILQYMHHTSDPRSVEFLCDYLQSQDVPFRDIAENALKNCETNRGFEYAYQGLSKNLVAAKQRTGRIKVMNQNLTESQASLEEFSGHFPDRPQTYIIDTKGVMYVGGCLFAHVQVAKGEKVLAAGEIELSKDKNDQWQVDMINYRSAGYYPAKSTFEVVKNSSRRAM